MQYGTLVSEWGVSKSALTGWVGGKVKDGILVWCDQNGTEFSEDAALKKAKRSGAAYIKINDAFHFDDVTGLPTPFELTGDPCWSEGGDLYNLYDLALDRDSVDSSHDTEMPGLEDQMEDKREIKEDKEEQMEDVKRWSDGIQF
ncbi:MAG: hypothetical protein U5J82_09785 [Desulfobacterales bacterium]|nr:hypothetical protein [Desulfobacterales bacterium]